MRERSEVKHSMGIRADMYINFWTQFYPVTVAIYNQAQSQHDHSTNRQDRGLIKQNRGRSEYNQSNSRAWSQYDQTVTRELSKRYQRKNWAWSEQDRCTKRKRTLYDQSINSDQGTQHNQRIIRVKREHDTPWPLQEHSKIIVCIII
jgi:hypothetical protein